MQEKERFQLCSEDKHWGVRFRFSADLIYIIEGVSKLLNFSEF